jgi:hypothetical protein
MSEVTHIWRVERGGSDTKFCFGKGRHGNIRRLKYNIKMDHKSTECERMVWSYLAQNRDKWWAVVNIVIFWLTKQPVAVKEIIASLVVQVSLMTLLLRKASRIACIVFEVLLQWRLFYVRSEDCFMFFCVMTQPSLVCGLHSFRETRCPELPCG